MDDLVIEIDDELLFNLARLAEAEGRDVELAGRILNEAMRERRG